jgi:hypothetical protein
MVTSLTNYSEMENYQKILYKESYTHHLYV